MTIGDHAGIEQRSVYLRRQLRLEPADADGEHGNQLLESLGGRSLICDAIDSSTPRLIEQATDLVLLLIEQFQLS